MAGISNEDIQKVRDANDIVAVIGEKVPLKQRGREFWCCCPLHHEKTPSFKIDPVRQFWHCFGCDDGGDVFQFVMKTENLNFPEAVRRLAERAHIEITEDAGHTSIPASKKARLKDICAKTADFYHVQLMRGRGEGPDAARTYLASRGFGGSVPKTWHLGFAPGNTALVHHLLGEGYKNDELVEANVAVIDRNGNLRDRFFNRVMFPISDEQGDCIAFGGRVIGTGEPKYMNSQETPLFHKSQVLYGLDKAKSSMASTGTALVVEGYTDVIALHEAGVTNAVATLGTALTMKHIRVLSRHASKRIVYLFDGDAAGQRAADRALGFIDNSMTELAGRARIELVAVTLPDNLDPAEYIQAHSAKDLQALIDQALPLLEYGIERRLDQADLTSPQGRDRALKECLQVLAPIKESLVAKDYAVRIWSRVRAAGQLGSTEEDVLELLASLKPPQPLADAEPDVATPEPPRRVLTPLEKNRLNVEREFLSLAATYPELGLTYASVLAQTQWHESVHQMLAESVLATLSDTPTATAAEVITRASQVSPHASRVLTSSARVEASQAEQTASYLAEELSLRDAEDAIGSLTAQMAQGATPEEAELLHTAITELQKDVAARRVMHRTPPAL